jgi:gliding motility-associated-like protein
VSYFVTYIYNNNPVSITITADGSGVIIITGLSSGTYTDISVSSFTCVSNLIGPIILSDPAAPPPPVLGSNSPVCAGKTLLLTSTDPVGDLTYSWTGPNGFTSNEQNPSIPNVTLTDSGYYSLTISHLNCISSATEHVIVYPPVVLTDVTESQVMPYGGNVQLFAAGALYYLWAPDNGTLSNPNIHNPIAAPQDSTTYIVTGMNEWGCRDSAYVTITISYDGYGAIPNAFTPNGDGKDDVFRMVNQQFVKLIDFSVFDRWGKLVYHNTYNAKEGWDGKYNGVPQDMGVYFYSIIIETPDGKNKTFKGDVTLIR